MSTVKLPNSASRNVRGWLTHVQRRQAVVEKARAALEAAEEQVRAAEKEVDIWTGKVGETSDAQVAYLTGFEKNSERVAAVQRLPVVRPDDTRRGVEFNLRSGEPGDYPRTTWKMPMVIPDCAGCGESVKVQGVTRYRSTGYEVAQEPGYESFGGPGWVDTGEEAYTVVTIQPARWFRERVWHLGCLETAVMDAFPELPGEPHHLNSGGSLT